MVSIKRYSPEDRQVWNGFINSAKNHHFMFNRDYMDYHADKFLDHSLMFLGDKNKLIAALPANEAEGVLWSHQGLTFGGVLSTSAMRASVMLDIFQVLVNYCEQSGFKKIIYKKMPHIYSRYPAEEDLYALFRNKARLVRRDISSAINLHDKIRYSKGRKYNISVAKKNHLTVKKIDDFSMFWVLLESVLQDRHGANPVHTLNEISILAGTFPENIQCYGAFDQEGNLLAGSVLYISDRVVHMQYLASSESGKVMGALDFVLDDLINNAFAAYDYFDFGTSNENQGLYLNEGLIAQKEGFGARAVCHDFYELNIEGEE